MFLYIAMITTVGAVLSERKRELFTKAVIWPVSIFYTVMAGFVIYTYISGKDVYLPCFEEAFSTFLGYRAFLAEENPNITAYWFMATGFFALWIFAKYKNTFAKFMSVLVFVMNYIALTAADSRNCKVAFSVGVSIIIIMLVLKRLKNKTTAKTALAVIATAIIALPLVYGSFSLTAKMSGRIAESVEEYESSRYTETAMKAENYYCSNLRVRKNSQRYNIEPIVSDRFVDNRGFEDSGRLPIYKGGLISLKEEPIRLLIGSAGDEIMSVTNKYLSELYEKEVVFHDHHNSFLNATISSGIPGIAIIIAFCVLLIRRMAIVFFTRDERVTADLIVLIAAIAAMFLYNMFETSIFNIFDIRSVLFFLCAGIFLACSYEICPPKRKSR